MQKLCRGILKGTISDAAEIQSAREKMSTMVEQLGGYGNLSSETIKLWSDQALKARGTTAPTIRDTFNKRNTALTLKSPIEPPKDLVLKLNQPLWASNGDINPNLPDKDRLESVKKLIQASKKTDVD